MMKMYYFRNQRPPRDDKSAAAVENVHSFSCYPSEAHSRLRSSRDKDMNKGRRKRLYEGMTPSSHHYTYGTDGPPPPPPLSRQSTLGRGGWGERDTGMPSERRRREERRRKRKIDLSNMVLDVGNDMYSSSLSSHSTFSSALLSPSHSISTPSHSSMSCLSPSSSRDVSPSHKNYIYSHQADSLPGVAISCEWPPKRKDALLAQLRNTPLTIAPPLSFSPSLVPPPRPASSLSSSPSLPLSSTTATKFNGGNGGEVGCDGSVFSQLLTVGRRKVRVSLYVVDVEVLCIGDKRWANGNGRRQGGRAKGARGGYCQRKADECRMERVGFFCLGLHTSMLPRYPSQPPSRPLAPHRATPVLRDFSPSYQKRSKTTTPATISSSTPPRCSQGPLSRWIGIDEKRGEGGVHEGVGGDMKRVGRKSARQRLKEAKEGLERQSEDEVEGGEETKRGEMDGGRADRVVTERWNVGEWLTVVAEEVADEQLSLVLHLWGSCRPAPDSLTTPGHCRLLGSASLTLNSNDLPGSKDLCHVIPQHQNLQQLSTQPANKPAAPTTTPLLRSCTLNLSSPPAPSLHSADPSSVSAGEGRRHEREGVPVEGYEEEARRGMRRKPGDSYGGTSEGHSGAPAGEYVVGFRRGWDTMTKDGGDQWDMSDSGRVAADGEKSTTDVCRRGGSDRDGGSSSAGVRPSFFYLGARVRYYGFAGDASASGTVEASAGAVRTGAATAAGKDSKDACCSDGGADSAVETQTGGEVEVVGTGESTDDRKYIQRQWMYVNDFGKAEGPFTSTAILDWIYHGYFLDSTPFRLAAPSAASLSPQLALNTKRALSAGKMPFPCWNMQGTDNGFRPLKDVVRMMLADASLINPEGRERRISPKLQEQRPQKHKSQDLQPQELQQQQQQQRECQQPDMRDPLCAFSKTDEGKELRGLGTAETSGVVGGTAGDVDASSSTRAPRAMLRDHLEALQMTLARIRVTHRARTNLTSQKCNLAEGPSEGDSGMTGAVSEDGVDERLKEAIGAANKVVCCPMKYYDYKLLHLWLHQ
eukprot:GHVQ01000827.1.p1 GENE.GHVQ01000827.1~~GHVQ01000827.1.p1  ORF type:complete len:1038 (-),score=222.14 GHVQ01000827.1:128-3241(-)